jgi:hypothetical protein
LIASEQGPAEAVLPDDAQFLRRAHLDLIGLLPTAEELAAFEKNPDRVPNSSSPC